MDITYEDISNRAYFIYLNTGCDDSVKNWYQARHELLLSQRFFWSQTGVAAIYDMIARFAEEDDDEEGIAGL
jgi:hypothetical protein